MTVTYIPKKPCRKGHMLRYRSDGNCVYCAREKSRRQRYGISAVEHYLWLADQDWQCAICGATEPGGPGGFHCDHDHMTGRMRGLLCNQCNVALGGFRDDPRILTAAIDYLSH